MLDINFIRDNSKKVQKACNDKKVDLKIDQILGLDKKRRSLLQDIEGWRCEKNKIGRNNIEKARELKDKIKNLEPELDEIEKELNKLLLKVPNIPLDDVPFGEDEEDNKKIREWGKPTEFDFKPKDHLDLGESLGVIDIERAAKVSGARFGYIKGKLALLEVALIRYVFETLTSQEFVKQIADDFEKGYSDKIFTPVFPPVMIRPDAYVKMARLSPEVEDERYYLEKDDLYLIGSAEHTLGSMHMDERISYKNFPLRYIGFSSSFRREAGSYGKDTRGIFRVHQFDKLEMESFTLPDNSLKEHKFLIKIQEYLMQSLKLPYRVMLVCTGDMGGPDARQVDIETWLPGQDKYRETHSADLMLDYQSRRLNTRFKKKGDLDFVHMNDATAFAIGRTLIAIMENYQQKDGSIQVPEVLQKYTNFKKID
jgi:seryl-tRNA synthetase